MNISVFGSTGGTGRHIIEQGILRGHGITAFTRRPLELAGMLGLHAIIQGDALSIEDVRKAVQGQDAVICSVSGVFRPNTIVSDIIRNTIQAMKEADVGRLIFLSSGLVDARRPWPLIKLIKWVFRHVLADVRLAEQLVKTSGLDWTIIRPTRLTDKPATGRIRRIYGGTVDSAPFQLTRADLTSAVLDTAVIRGDIGALYEVTEARSIK